MLPFERSEYLGRVAATKRRMEAAGIEVQLVSDPCNMNHLTGYDATSYYLRPPDGGHRARRAGATVDRAGNGHRLRPLHHLSAAGEHARLSRELYRRPGPAPDGVRGHDVDRDGLGPPADWRRDGRAFLQRALLHRIGEPPAGGCIRRCQLAGQLGADREIAAGDRLHAAGAAWRKVASADGIEKSSRIGYAIGIGYPRPSWNERTASLQPWNTTVLEPNMTFHMILGMWLADWGFEISETFRVTEGAPEVFSHVPREVFVKG